MYRYVYLKAASSSINYEDTSKTQYHQLFFFFLIIHAQDYTRFIIVYNVLLFQPFVQL